MRLAQKSGEDATILNLPASHCLQPGHESRSHDLWHIRHVKLEARMATFGHNHNNQLAVGCGDLHLLARLHALGNRHAQRQRWCGLGARRGGRGNGEGLVGKAFQNENGSDPGLVIQHPQQSAHGGIALSVAPQPRLLEHGAQVVLAEVVGLQPAIDGLFELRAELPVQLCVHQGMLLRIAIEVAPVVHEEASLVLPEAIY
mmetsp:Transcript_47698/g.120899  ORF Transcript_47698/g.120899 Transcript_47698/m.120899 type:complete len:201 (-) Transcript_47698:148-750(-)|eukprot:CAMPEP_0183433634 /NCGR_PEP_ID=MMETSP0370-20130417/61519_1 /TAXON_ID=268820 /ORGANISM="Peridinium aciculiferum, Strain PAER-2" /LENGTH=200 /DNA_ID=CAMNT_0025620023 /DNA_START=116 /DNA_END=718 /DNA_ORIENTATION=+